MCCEASIWNFETMLETFVKKNEQKTSTLKKAVIAACVLHNICIEQGDLYDTDSGGLDDSFENDENEGRAVFYNGNRIGFKKHLKTLWMKICNWMALFRVSKFIKKEKKIWKKKHFKGKTWFHKH